MFFLILLYNFNMAISIDLGRLIGNASGSTIGVAISGGRDSVALLHCMIASGAKVIAVNVEHGIRGESSRRDSAFVAELCKRWNVPLKTFCVDAPSYSKQRGYTVEQGARELRYGIFDELLQSGACDYIALAHHLDDQAETLLMRMLRGTGVRGLVGMRQVCGRYLRPFLPFTREEINEYVAANGLEFVEDETNSDTRYTRNLLRAQLAELKKSFPRLNASLARLSRSAEELENFVDALTPEIERFGGAAYIKIADMEQPVIAKNLIFKSANALGVRQDIEEKHYAAVLELIRAQSGKRIDLAHGLVAHKEDGFVVLERDGGSATDDRYDRCEPFSVGIHLGGEVTLTDVPDDLAAEQRRGVLYASAKKIPSDAVIRFRRAGDHINKFGGGSKSLGDFLTDKKVPLRLRDRLPVVACGSEILAVFGVDVSSMVRLDGDEKTAYRLSLEVKLGAENKNQ